MNNHLYFSSVLNIKEKPTFNSRIQRNRHVVHRKWFVHVQEEIGGQRTHISDFKVFHVRVGLVGRTPQISEIQHLLAERERWFDKLAFDQSVEQDISGIYKT